MKTNIFLLIALLTAGLSAHAEDVTMVQASSYNKVAELPLQNNPKLVIGADENVFTDGTSSTAFSKDERVVIKIKLTKEQEDGISLTPNPSPRRGEMYDLSGRKVSKPTKGLYIQDGRKVLLK